MSKYIMEEFYIFNMGDLSNCQRKNDQRNIFEKRDKIFYPLFDRSRPLEKYENVKYPRFTKTKEMIFEIYNKKRRLKISKFFVQKR